MHNFIMLMLINDPGALDRHLGVNHHIQAGGISHEFSYIL